jgi:putative hydrolase of the HAD superfamily
MSGAVTFDFHNTLVQAEAWFELEVRGLVGAFLRWRADTYGVSLANGAEEAARTAYRRLRVQIMSEGEELPAERCVEIVLSELELPADRVTIEQGVRELMASTLAGAALLPGAIETVKTLAAAGVTLGVISSAVYHPFLVWSLDRFGLLDVFSTVTTSASSGYYKSRPEIYQQTLAALGVSPAASVHVGDSWRFDVQTARRVGMRTVWLNRDGDPGDGEEADLILSSLEWAAEPIQALLNHRQIDVAREFRGPAMER